MQIEMSYEEAYGLLNYPESPDGQRALELVKEAMQGEFNHDKPHAVYRANGAFLGIFWPVENGWSNVKNGTALLTKNDGDIAREVKYEEVYEVPEVSSKITDHTLSEMIRRMNMAMGSPASYCLDPYCETTGTDYMIHARMPNCPTYREFLMKELLGQLKNEQTARKF